MTDELLVLGSSCALPTRQRFTSAYALTVAGKLFLLDCGAPVSALLYQYGLDPLDVQTVFLSHWHLDHVAGLGLFLSQNHLQKRPRPLCVYGPSGTRGKIQRLLTDSFLLPEELNYELKVTNIKAGNRYKEGLIRITYFKTQHLEQAKYKNRFGRKAMACGMVIDGPGWRLVYSGDLRSSKELTPYISGCDLLIHEMTHPALQEVVEFVSQTQVPHVLISHLAPEFDETPEKIAEAFVGHYTGQLTIAEDGTRISLSDLVTKK